MAQQINPLRRQFFQNAWVVDDIEAAIHQWSQELGVGPFFVTEYRDLFSHVRYRGEAAELEMIVALAQNGAMQIELIQPLVARCAYRDSVAFGTGFHHMCVWSDSVPEDMAYFANLGYPVVNSASVGSVDFAYFDTRSMLGCMLEVATKNRATEEKFAEIAAAGANWDGRNPIRQ